MAIMPGALWRPISRNYQRKTTVKDCVILHSTASKTAKSMHSWFNKPGANASSHFHVDDKGLIEQYIDTDFVSWANGSANSRSITIETQGDGTTPWTSAQVAAIVRIIVWARTEHPQIPARQMESSARTEKGIGWHRLGVNGNFPATGILRGRGQRGGGESWSSAFGKVCPGDDRIRQVPGIVAQVAAGTATTATTSTPKPTPTTPTLIPKPTPTPDNIERVIAEMEATHIIFEFQEGKGTALAIANVLAGTWTRFGSTDDYKARLTVLRRSGAKVEEWKKFKTGKNPNNIASPAAFGVEVKA